MVNPATASAELGQKTRQGWKPSGPLGPGRGGRAVHVSVSFLSLLSSSRDRHVQPAATDQVARGGRVGWGGRLSPPGSPGTQWWGQGRGAAMRTQPAAGTCKFEPRVTLRTQMAPEPSRCCQPRRLGGWLPETPLCPPWLAWASATASCHPRHTAWRSRPGCPALGSLGCPYPRDTERAAGPGRPAGLWDRRARPGSHRASRSQPSGLGWLWPSLTPGLPGLGPGFAVRHLAATSRRGSVGSRVSAEPRGFPGFWEGSGIKKVDVGPRVKGEGPGQSGQSWEGLSPLQEVDGRIPKRACPSCCPGLAPANPSPLGPSPPRDTQ